MPELPEVETIRGHLAPHVEGRTLERVEILDARWCRPIAPEELAFAVAGREVERLSRRGKYLVWELSDDVYLLMHLRMTGTLLLDPDPPTRHTRVRIALRADAAGGRAPASRDDDLAAGGPAPASRDEALGAGTAGRRGAAERDR